jgi:hypothetical protein
MMAIMVSTPKLPVFYRSLRLNDMVLPNILKPAKSSKNNI